MTEQQQAAETLDAETVEETAPKKPVKSKEEQDAADARIASLEDQLSELKNLLTAAVPKATASDFDFAPGQYQGYLDNGPDAMPAPAPQQRKSLHMTVRELRAYDGPLYVRHNDPWRQFSCHQPLGEHRVDFDLGPAGSPDAIGYFPKLALEIRGIQRSIKRGTITVSTDESMEDEIELAMGAHIASYEEQMASIMAPLQPSNTESDIVTRPCLACGEYVIDPATNEKTMVIRGGQVFQRFADYKSGEPPLCDLHINQAHLWHGDVVEDPTTGVRDWRFTSALVGAPQPGIQTNDPRATRIRRVGV